jgi:eukaryotic-like serine/threonine-protein kinase
MTNDASTPSSAPDLQGTRIGIYKIEQLLGQGGMGAVYSARSEAGREVAIKVLLEGRATQPDVRTRFQREWSVLEKIVHPNVVRLVDFPRSKQGPLYYVMELLRGQSLSDRLESEKFALADALALFADLVKGLCAVHEAGIVHRDIKPQNVFLCAAADTAAGFTAKILDFGFARVVGSQITGSGLLVGTPAYAAPEQASGDTVDVRVDVYALGLVMYKVLTGQHPFSTDDQVATLGHQLLSPPPPLSWLDEAVPVALEALVLRMLRKRPEDRPQSMREVEQALAQLGHGEVAEDSPFEDRPSNPIDDRYGPLNPLAERLVNSTLVKKGFRREKK